MPELLTKYPDVAVKILKDAGAKCGGGGSPQILKSCPADQFCALPTGEFCVYGLPDAARMTQLTSVDIASVTSHVPTMFDWPNAVLLGIVFLAGMIVGKYKF